MKTFYEVRAKVVRLSELGNEIKGTETYLTEALSVTEAEANIVRELAQRARELEVISVKKYRHTDILINDKVGEYKYFETKLQSEHITEKGKKKNISFSCLVEATDIEEAQKRAIQSTSTLLNKYEIAQVKETKILNVFFHLAE